MKKIKLAGIPMNSGGFYTGAEMTPKILREAGIIEALENRGVEVVDSGDVRIPSYIPRHNIPPIRNWPGPRVMWEEICHQSKDWFNEDETLGVELTEFFPPFDGDGSQAKKLINMLVEVFGD